MRAAVAFHKRKQLSTPARAASLRPRCLGNFSALPPPWPAEFRLDVKDRQCKSALASPPCWAAILDLRPEKVKALIPVAAAAAIAAAFNTPLAAVLFALEEIVGDLHAPVLGSVVLAAATSWGVLRLMLGNDPLFKVPQYQLVNPWEFAIYAVLGVAGGLVSVAFTKLLLGMRERFLKFSRKTVPFQPVIGGVVVGLMGWFVPQVLGVGYEHVGAVLNGGMALRLMVLLLVLKLFAVTTSYASGNAGGIFGPSLFLGAMLGGTIGTVAHNLLPKPRSDAGRLRSGGNGHGLCRNRSRADDLRRHDF